MTTTSAAKADRLDTTPQGRSLLQASAAAAAAAAIVNAALWAGGRAADVSFTVSSAFITQVSIAIVVLTTLLAFAVGAGLLALAARRSRRWVRAVIVAAALVALVSAGAPLSAAHDTTTGVLLATMHLVTGAAFLITARRVFPPIS
jgi:peptidoglycan/LPS O-acetylase OafA/YrhL